MEDIVGSGQDAGDFSIRTGYYLACASKAAYYHAPGDWVKTLGLRTAEVFNSGQFHGFVGWLGRAALVTFRGTESVGNCLTDLETPLVQRPPYSGRIHLGFAEAVTAVWPQVLRLLGDPRRAMPVWLAGHSLGGAMATLAAVRLVSEGYNVRAVYTCGSPRAGNHIFRNSYKLANFRFVNQDDIVPHLPFRWCYKHVGRLKLLDQDGDLTESEAAWKALKRAMAQKARQVQQAHAGQLGVRRQISEFEWLTDHHVDQYLAAIWRVLARVPQRRPDQLGNIALELPDCKPRMDAGSPSGGRPARPHDRPKTVISEAAFAEAFFRQGPGAK